MQMNMHDVLAVGVGPAGEEAMPAHVLKASTVIVKYFTPSCPGMVFSIM
jgi:hypothetical protein